MNSKESVREPKKLELTDVFKSPYIYTDTHYNIVYEERHVGSYGGGVILLMVDYLPVEMLDWLSKEIVGVYKGEFGYVFMLNGLPILKLSGQRERKNMITFKVKSLLKFSPYYTTITGSNELLETLPFSPLDIKENTCRKIMT